MAKRKTTEEMQEEINSLHRRLDDQDRKMDHQEKQLDEVLLCLKGNSTLNFEGIMPAQRRIEHQMQQLSAKVEAEIEEIRTWKNSLQAYFNILTSRGIRWLVILVILAFVFIFVGLKFGWGVVWKMILSMFQ